MKKWMLLLSFMTLQFQVSGQVLQEFIQQKETQLTYLTQQLTELRTYGDLMKTGYELTRQGLARIGQLKTGSHILHQNYYQTFYTVSPAVLEDWRIPAMIRLQDQILERYDQCLEWCKRKHKPPWLASYAQSVFDQLVEGCLRDLYCLDHVTQSNTLQLTSEERVNRIRALYRDMMNKKAFIQHFSREVSHLSANDAKQTQAPRS